MLAVSSAGRTDWNKKSWETIGFPRFLLFCGFTRKQVHCDVYADEQQDACAQDEVHRRDLDLVAEEIDVAVDAVTDGGDDLCREAETLHLGEAALYGVVADKARTVGTREKAQRLLQSLTKRRHRHVRSADEAVACADYGSDGGCLPVGGQEEVHARGQRSAEHGEQEHIQKHQQHITRRHEPADCGKVAEAHRKRRDAYDKR